MSEKVVRAFFALLASALNNSPVGEAAAETDVDTLKAAFSLAKRQDLVALLARGLEVCGVALEDEELCALVKRETMTSFIRYERANYELHAICRALGEAGIEHVPLKGAVMRNYYSEPWYRTSCDVDILVKAEEVDRAAEKLVSALGYEIGERGSHDLGMKARSGVYLELHFDLNEPDYKSFDCLSDAWSYMSPRESAAATMDMRGDLFCFYHVAHMAKHVVNGGCGVRPFIDLWLMRRSGEFDEAATLSLLGREGLLGFFECATRLSEVWFSGDEPDERSLNMQAYILGGGLYGNVEQRVRIQQVKRGGKLKYLLSRIFLPYSQMKYRYPVVVKHRWLMPFMHIRRWFGIIFGGGVRRSVNELKTAGAVDNGEIDATRRFLADIGL